MNSTHSGISKRRPHTLRLLALVLIALAVVVLSGFDGSCGSQKPDNIVITYRPLVNFRAYDSADYSADSSHHFTPASPGTMYTVYKILSIQNNRKDDFNFQAEKIFINGAKGYRYGSGGLPNNDLRLNFQTDYLVGSSFAQTVHPGTVTFDNGPQVRIMMIDTQAVFETPPPGQTDPEKTAYAKLAYNCPYPNDPPDAKDPYRCTAPDGTIYHVNFVPDASLPAYIEVATPQILEQQHP